LARKGRANIVPWDIDAGRQTVRLREPVSRKIKLEFSALPMLGCVGVAATGRFCADLSACGSYGGNLDYNQVAEGTTVMLPVYHSRRASLHW
jgi:acetamidase/formamidase